MPTDILGQASKISSTTSIGFLFLNDRELVGQVESVSVRKYQNTFSICLNRDNLSCNAIYTAYQCTPIKVIVQLQHTKVCTIQSSVHACMLHKCFTGIFPFSVIYTYRVVYTSLLSLQFPVRIYYLHLLP